MSLDKYKVAAAIAVYDSYGARGLYKESSVSWRTESPEIYLIALSQTCAGGLTNVSGPEVAKPPWKQVPEMLPDLGRLPDVHARGSPLSEPPTSGMTSRSDQ